VGSQKDPTIAAFGSLELELQFVILEDIVVNGTAGENARTLAGPPARTFSFTSSTSFRRLLPFSGYFQTVYFSVYFIVWLGGGLQHVYFPVLSRGRVLPSRSQFRCRWAR